MQVEIKTSKKASKVFTLLSFEWLNGWIRLFINILALIVSWYFNKSILWAIFHFIFGAWYLIYRLLKGSFANGGFMEIMNHYF
jgi:hypothetical protein